MTKNEELKVHLNALLDELKWFHSQEIGLRISPKAAGWNLSILPAMTAGTHFRDLSPQELSIAEYRSQIGDPRL